MEQLDYTSKMKIVINWTMEERRETNFLSEPGKASWSEFTSNQEWGPERAAWQRVLQTAVSTTIPLAHPTSSPHLETSNYRCIFWVLTVWILHQIRILPSKKFYAVCHRMVPQMSACWKLTLNLVFHGPGGSYSHSNTLFLGLTHKGGDKYSFLTA